MTKASIHRLSQVDDRGFDIDVASGYDGRSNKRPWFKTSVFWCSAATVLLTLVAVVGAVVFFQATAGNASFIDHTSELGISPADDRAYRLVTLRSNDLQVLVVSDPNTDVASAALDVKVGSFSNPVEWPGLAHFLEHMLFMG
jgi:hypothetical protein